MTIKTSTFGGLTLTGEDARRFREQAENPKANPAALESLERSRKRAVLVGLALKNTIATHRRTLEALAKV